MIVCLCEGVPLRQVREVIADGAQTLDQITRACGAGSDCGACHQHLAALLESKGTGGPAPASPCGKSCGDCTRGAHAISAAR